ncbi:ChbG/HpnK family deacetylase [candidate division WS5 bacterium]|uniref:ChbG/HpnK family deacetylase n=1 Tax=candidate division WS5 bacterium TaxID=2093353 RepID=A0A419DBF9_9BACT|nr:MAG: ChbG/HpnK family deacetylase [candidate division WS5 bacterium]
MQISLQAASKDIIFINGDDFGLDKRTNERIVHCLSNNLISSTTLLANKPGFEDAIELIHKYKFNGRVGFHVNLTDGLALSDEMKNFIGADISKFKAHLLKHFFTKVERQAIYSEIRAQLQTIFDNGVVPTHIDSHGHIHRYLGILMIMQKVAEEYQIKYIRRMKNLYMKKNITNIVFKRIYNICYSYIGIVSTKYVTSLYPYVLNNCKLKNIELICHPGNKEEFNFLCADRYSTFLLERKKDIRFEPFFINNRLIDLPVKPGLKIT